MNDVFLSTEPDIGTITKYLGETKARAAVVYLLADALEFFNASETMSDTQVAMTVDLILEEYPYMKTDDIKLCFKNAMKMKYGRLYNRIDGQIIMGWFREYNKERCSVADNQSWNEHKSLISLEANTEDGVFYEEYIGLLQKKADSGDENAKKTLENTGWVKREIDKRTLEKKKADLEAFYERNKKQ